ncbi:protein-L-isoaspartate(D-aspartate) O-methyltransferase [Saccharopolyspora lacisalsi]|uniref:Protein-L-isoaspartate O-methyltransferase n=1 Tax=Halosaccharopolyspora lacisalsi TaxID=1000566 RepID=A0A839DUS1_9PSEU|nr:protein-L-isoaspartate(D-aspartate) O-methyltransferase [Halosaccharopolyspora lacisalsi]MBA8824660.1 protein-L-isoaspartate(D-aspartate) O-methyltransferase [Halosaccharopolyspora lacisalsi]
MAGDERARRSDMVDSLRRGGISNRYVLEAMAEVPRQRFVDPELVPEAYTDQPLPIGSGQTISVPWIVALMAEALDPSGTENVLEIGTGSGYAAAVLARCCRRVTSVERHADLAEGARRTLAELDYDNVEVRHGDGARGAPDRAPFDGISVTAMAEEIPQPLLEQLGPDGTLVCPVGHGGLGDLVRLRHGRRETLSSVGFVPLVTDES